jgi:hypothetical protein
MGAPSIHPGMMQKTERLDRVPMHFHRPEISVWPELSVWTEEEE